MTEPINPSGECLLRSQRKSCDFYTTRNLFVSDRVASYSFVISVNIQSELWDAPPSTHVRPDECLWCSNNSTKERLKKRKWCESQEWILRGVMEKNLQTFCSWRNFKKKTGQRFQRADVRHCWTIMQNAYKEVFWLKWATRVTDASGVVRFSKGENFSLLVWCLYWCVSVLIFKQNVRYANWGAVFKGTNYIFLVFRNHTDVKQLKMSYVSGWVDVTICWI